MQINELQPPAPFFFKLQWVFSSSMEGRKITFLPIRMFEKSMLKVLRFASNRWVNLAFDQ